MCFSFVFPFLGKRPSVQGEPLRSRFLLEHGGPVVQLQHQEFRLHDPQTGWNGTMILFVILQTLLECQHLTVWHSSRRGDCSPPTVETGSCITSFAAKKINVLISLKPQRRWAAVEDALKPQTGNNSNKWTRCNDTWWTSEESPKRFYLLQIFNKILCKLRG